MHNWIASFACCPSCKGDLGLSSVNCLRCDSCEAEFPICDGIPLLLPPNSYRESVKEISSVTAIRDTSRFERTLAAALRFRLNDCRLRAEFGGVVDRYVSTTAEPSQSEHLEGRPLKLIADYFTEIYPPNAITHRNVRVENCWARPLSSEGEKPYHISYWLYDHNDIAIEGIRTKFPIPLQPGAELTISVQLATPTPGRYRLEVLLVRENERWFSENLLVTRSIMIKEGASEPNGVFYAPHNGYFDFEEDIISSGKVYADCVSMLSGRLGRAITVLEVACGSDPLTARFPSPLAKVIATDLSLPQLMLRAAALGSPTSELGGVNLICCNLEFPPFRDNSIDLIVISAALHHATMERCAAL